MRTNVVLRVSLLFDTDTIRGVPDEVIAAEVAKAVTAICAQTGLPAIVTAHPVIREHNVIDGPVTVAPRTAGQ